MEAHELRDHHPVREGEVPHGLQVEVGGGNPEGSPVGPGGVARVPLAQGLGRLQVVEEGLEDAFFHHHGAGRGGALGVKGAGEEALLQGGVVHEGYEGACDPLPKPPQEAAFPLQGVFPGESLGEDGEEPGHGPGLQVGPVAARLQGLGLQEPCRLLPELEGGAPRLQGVELLARLEVPPLLDAFPLGHDEASREGGEARAEASFRPLGAFEGHPDLPLQVAAHEDAFHPGVLAKGRLQGEGRLLLPL